MKKIDLRSDTVTHPSPAMKKAMMNAELGDDVFQDDPTVNNLEKTAAALFGKESALLVPSGTMANLVSVLAHCERGEEVILGNKCHTFIYEAGGIAEFGGVHPHTLINQPDGTIDLDDIRHAIRPDDVHFPHTKLIALENTHNKCNGTPVSVEYIKLVSDIAQENDLKLHIDGARIFNASVALGKSVQQLNKYADSVSFCMSKGLSAPVGSVIIGDSMFIQKARRIRKALGGGMRQAGVLAAAGLVALGEMIPQIKLDHENARILADGISQIDGLDIDPRNVKTNIVYFGLASNKMTTSDLVQKMEDRGIRFLALGPNQFRMVTHYGIERKDISTTLDVMAHLLKN